MTVLHYLHLIRYVLELPPVIPPANLARIFDVTRRSDTWQQSGRRR
ncbi:hypothetical protein GCM10022275_06580 [Tessaracoccus defluvii]